MPALILMAVFFGDLHIHTAISSDAVGDPTTLFQVARVEENLDFVAITDHDTTLDAAEWDLTRNLAAAANDPGNFVAFSGIEWTWNQHIAVYFLNDDEPFCATGCGDLPAFYNFYGPVLAAQNAGAHIAHPTVQGPVTILDDSILTNVEIKNGRSHAFEMEYGPLGTVELLSQGHRLGFVGVSDDHSFDGTGESIRRLGDTVTGCHATTLTRASILEALRTRRCFATDNLRTVVDMDVVGTLMGGETTLCSGSNYPVDLTVSGTATPSLVEIVRDGIVIASRANCTSPNCDLSTTVFATPGFINLYGRVTHDPSTGCVNCKTWSSPVKVNTSTEPSCISTGVPSIGGAGTAILIAALALAAAFALRSIRPA